MLAYAVHETGRREVIGLDLGEVESEAFWTELLRDLRRRGLQGVRLCVSDQRGLVSAALREVFNAESRGQARERVGEVIARLRGPAPKVAELLEEAEEDLLAF